MPQRVPPQAIQAEACVLGSMILHGPAIDVVVQILRPEQFYRPAHQTLFQILCEMSQAAKPIDLVTLRDELDRRKQLEAVGGIEYLVELVEGVPTAANAEYYSRVVRDKALLRDLILVGTDIVQEAYETHEDAGVVLDRAEQKVFDIAFRRVGDEAVTMEALMEKTFHVLENQSGELVTGLGTPYQKLNELTSGFQNGDMVVLAARPSMGKTSVLLNLAEYAAIEDKVPIAFFSLEMSKEQLALRLLASHARFDLRKMRRGMIGPEEWTHLQTAAGDLYHAPLFIDDTALLTVLALRAKARRLKAAHDVKAIFVDYLQLMTYQGQSNSRWEQITEISRGIKALARELEVPVIVAAQLNRGPEDRPTHRPRMSDLRESGSIEQDADVVMLLHNEDYYHRGEPDYVSKDITEMIIAKQRNGPTDTVYLRFQPNFTRFEAAASDSAGM
jgi:replicative DNA helicase